MIKFEGMLSDKCKKFIIKKQMKLQIIACSITAILFSIPVLFAIFLWKPIAAVGLFPPVFFLLLSLIPPGKSTQGLFIPQIILFDLEEETVIHKCEKMERFHMINSITKVIDYGEWYYLIFQYSDRDLYFVCQKDLLTEGSIEDFEDLFKDKIEVRYRT